MDFIFVDEDKLVNTNIEEVLETDPETNESVLTMKTINENKSNDHSQHELLRCQLIQRLLDGLATIQIKDEGQMALSSLDELVCYNTCIQYGFVAQAEE